MGFANREASQGSEGLIAAEPPSAHATLNAEPFAMGGGAVRNDLSTALVKLYREIFGRGPVKTTTYAFDAGYVTFLRDLLTPHERVLVLGGRLELVCQARVAIREAERERLIAEVQRLARRPVLHDSFQFQPERDLAIELFWIPTGSGDGAGNTPAPQAVAPTGSRHRRVISDGER
jgi:uncharacterized protein YbcI